HAELARQRRLGDPIDDTARRVLGDLDVDAVYGVRGQVVLPSQRQERVDGRMGEAAAWVGLEPDALLQIVVRPESLEWRGVGGHAGRKSGVEATVRIQHGRATGPA